MSHSAGAKRTRKAQPKPLERGPTRKREEPAPPLPRRVEQAIQRFNAGFWITVSPGSAHWARTRALELTRQGRGVEVVLVWGGRRFRAGEKLFGGDPYLAIELEDGTLERSPFAQDQASIEPTRVNGSRKAPNVPLHELKRSAIQSALRATQGNVAEAARQLGIGRATLYRHIARLTEKP